MVTNSPNPNTDSWGSLADADAGISKDIRSTASPLNDLERRTVSLYAVSVLNTGESLESRTQRIPPARRTRALARNYLIYPQPPTGCLPALSHDP
jgi:hypothetical protein